MRSKGSDETGEINPEALAFSPQANAFYSLEATPHKKSGSSRTSIDKINWLAGKLTSVQIATLVPDPINLTFDGKAQRLLILQPAANSLVEVLEGTNGELEPQKVRSYEISRFGLQDPQGLSVDPASGRLFILDAAGPRLLRVDPAASGALDKGTISSVRLSAPGLSSARGLAFDPSSGHLHVLADKRLYEFSQDGAVIASRDLAEFALVQPQGMVFAPSGDLTDDPLEMSLFLVDSGALTSGQILEFTFSEPVAVAADFTSTLIRTTDMSAISPPSPDPSGLTYIPASNRLVMVDGEVEETVNRITHFQGANVWELTLDGSVIRTANISKVPPTVVPMTNEPTGVTWNPSNGHYYISDDGNKEIYDLDPGADGLIGTADDSWTHFDTLVHGNSDPEGIAFDTSNARIFVADGLNREIYQYDLNGNLIDHFDVKVYGAEDPESVEFNDDGGTLFVMSSNRVTPVIIETTTSGALIQTIDISAANARAAAGLAFTSASDGSGTKSYYIVDRGIDNNANPNIIDGLMYEMTSPYSGAPVNHPPEANDDFATTEEDTPVLIDVAANDTDPDGEPDKSSTDTACSTCAEPANGSLINHGDGTFTYTPNSNFNGSDSFVYKICDLGSLCDTATVYITVTPINDPPVANDDAASTAEDTPLNINVMANDTDPEGKLNPASTKTSCPSCTNPTNGSLLNHKDGTFTYTPNSNFNGSDSFVYEICDLGSPSLCGTASVSITVTPVNDPPVAKNDNAATAEDTPVTINVAANDSDPEGSLDKSSANTACPSCKKPAHGSLVNNRDGTFKYTPDKDFNGSDSFVYQICDTLGLCDTATVSIKVTAVKDYFYSFIPVASNGTAHSIGR